MLHLLEWIHRPFRGYVLCSIFFGLSLSTLYPAVFGKNKPQYKHLHWSYLQTRHFDVYFYEGGKRIAEKAAGYIEVAYQSVSADFSYQIQKRIPVIVYNSHTDFEQTNVILENIDESIGGFTELFKNRIVIPFDGSYENLRHVLHHELVHAIMFEMLYGNLLQSVLSRQYLFHLPLWVSEGIAEFEALDWDINSDMWMRDLTVNGYLPQLDQGVDGYLAYRAGQSFFSFLSKKFGRRKIGRFIINAKKLRNLEKALEVTFGQNLSKLQILWGKYLKYQYWPEIAIRQQAEDIATKLTDHVKDLSYFNLQPAISPDGKHIAFFSDRKDYIDIFIMSSVDGRLEKHIFKGGRSGTHESFHPTESGLSWSPDGKNLIFVAKSQGKNYLQVIDAKTGKKKRKLDFNKLNLDAVRSPHFSPDGQKIVFSGIREGQTDLYIVTLDNKNKIQLTNDPDNDIQPSWSPDGQWIAYASDYASPDTLGLREKRYDIYMLRPDGRENRRLTSNYFNDISPIWNPDGEQIFFTSDRSGISNIYMHSLKTGQDKPLTNVLEGIFSPSISGDGKKIAFSAMNRLGFDIFVMKNFRQVNLASPLPITNFIKSLSETLLVKDTLQIFSDTDSLISYFDTPFEISRAETLSFKQTLDTTERYAERTLDMSQWKNQRSLRDPAQSAFFEDSLNYKTHTGDFKIHPYHLKFTPDLVSANLGLSFPRGSWSGQTMLSFSDILGNHRFTLFLQLYNLIIENLDDADFYMSYLYLPLKVDIGGYVYRSRNFVLYENNRYDPQLGFHDSLYSDVNFAAGGVFLLPLSIFNRLEMNLNYLNISRDIYIVYFDPDVDPKKIPQSSEYLINPALSWIFDNILWGITGPLNGHRSNLTLGIIPENFSNRYGAWLLTGDGRKYFHFFRKYSLALRVAGGLSKSLAGANNPVRFYLGGDENWLVNYRINESNYNTYLSVQGRYFSEIVTPLRGYDYLDFEGTHYTLFNSEFRFPFISNITFEWPLRFWFSVQGAFFMDLGGVWTDLAQFHPFEKGSNFKLQDLKGGVGYGFRANLGIFVLRYDLAWATDLHRLLTGSRSYISLGAEF